MIQSKSSKLNRLRFESGVMTQFDKPQVVRLRVGRAILLFAAMAGMAAFLCKVGADGTARNGAGRTPLECARAYRRSEAAAALEAWESEDD
ncbi:MAG: hypothetical protein NTU83_10535 [Candidatus Hydrogenedentes bacterium]|nr:hypothetical protein [Candidatus Hydrogenedentota bacterium]